MTFSSLSWIFVHFESECQRVGLGIIFEIGKLGIVWLSCVQNLFGNYSR